MKKAMSPLARRKHSLAYGFQPGNVANRLKKKSAECLMPEKNIFRYIRPTKQEFELLTAGSAGQSVDSSFAVVDSEGRPVQHRFLRPQKSCPTPLEASQQEVPGSDGNTYAIYHCEKVEELFHEAHTGHQKYAPGCTARLKFDPSRRIQRGLAWKEMLYCDSCSYRTPLRKVYTTVNSSKRGPKTATINYAAQVGLSHTSTSNTGFSNILLAMNIPSPSISGMQKCANKVGDMLVEHNKADMRQIRCDLQHANSLKGLSTTAPINVEMDGRYSNPIYSAVGNSPFQAATQVSHVTAESVTSKKYVIDIQTHSKLCQQGEILRKKTGHRPCPDHPGCTADLAQNAVIGNEKQWAQDSLLGLSGDGINVNIVTTDPDSSSYRAAAELYGQGTLTTQPQHQLDTHHISRGQRKNIKTTYFSQSMFPGDTAAERRQLQNRLADDVPARCTAEHKVAWEQYAGDVNKIKRAMTYVRDAMVHCYQGNHSLCRRHSGVCRAKKKKNWLIDSAFLPENFVLNCNDTDKEKLERLIDYRLGQKVIEKTKHLLTTQKCEAVNRAISSTTPKNKTFSRNFAARVHSAVNAVNRGIGDSILSQTQFIGAPVTPGSKVTRGLLRRQKHDNNRKQAKRAGNVKAARIEKRRILFALKETCAEQKVSGYKRDIAMKETCLVKKEHSYSK